MLFKSLIHGFSRKSIQLRCTQNERPIFARLLMNDVRTSADKIYDISRRGQQLGSGERQCIAELGKGRCSGPSYIQPLPSQLQLIQMHMYVDHKKQPLPRQLQLRYIELDMCVDPKKVYSLWEKILEKAYGWVSWDRMNKLSVLIAILGVFPYLVEQMFEYRKRQQKIKEKEKKKQVRNFEKDVLVVTLLFLISSIEELKGDDIKNKARGFLGAMSEALLAKGSERDVLLRKLLNEIESYSPK